RGRGLADEQRRGPLRRPSARDPIQTLGVLSTVQVMRQERRGPGLAGELAESREHVPGVHETRRVGAAEREVEGVGEDRYRLDVLDRGTEVREIPLVLQRDAVKTNENDVEVRDSPVTEG